MFNQSACTIYKLLLLIGGLHNRIGGVMISALTSSVIDRSFEPLSGQTKYLWYWYFLHPYSLSTQH